MKILFGGTIQLQNFFIESFSGDTNIIPRKEFLLTFKSVNIFHGIRASEGRFCPLKVIID